MLAATAYNNCAHGREHLTSRLVHYSAQELAASIRRPPVALTLAGVANLRCLLFCVALQKTNEAAPDRTEGSELLREVAVWI